MISVDDVVKLDRLQMWKDWVSVEDVVLLLYWQC